MKRACRIAVLGCIAGFLGMPGCAVSERDSGYEPDHAKQHDSAWHERCDNPREDDKDCYE
jgi:hypothetical protein